MNCPVCQEACQESTLQNSGIIVHTCTNNSHELVHNYVYYINGPYESYSLILPDIHFELDPVHNDPYRWSIHTFNVDKSETTNLIAQGYDSPTPEQGYQLLLRYDNLLTFS